MRRENAPSRLRTPSVLLGVVLTDGRQLFDAVVHAFHKTTELFQALLAKTHDRSTTLQHLIVGQYVKKNMGSTRIFVV